MLKKKQKKTDNCTKMHQQASESLNVAVASEDMLAIQGANEMVSAAKFEKANLVKVTSAMQERQKAGK